MTVPADADEVPTRIGQAVILLHGGDREEARNRFAALWEELGEHGPPLHRCTLAHYMADAQDDPEQELAWDLRALRTADRHLAAPATPGQVRPLGGLYPALHLNLAADYHGLGEPRLAGGHLAVARAAAGMLPDDAYADGIRAAIVRLGRRLAGGRPADPPGQPPGPLP